MHYLYIESCLQDTTIDGKIEWKLFTCADEIDEEERVETSRKKSFTIILNFRCDYKNLNIAYNLTLGS